MTISHTKESFHHRSHAKLPIYLPFFFMLITWIFSLFCILGYPIGNSDGVSFITIKLSNPLKHHRSLDEPDLTVVSPRGFSDLDNAAKKKAKGAVEDTLDALKPPVVTVYMLSVCIAQPRKDRKDDEGNFDHSDRTCSSRIGSFRNNPLKKIHSDYADLGIVKRDRRGQSNDHAINMPALWFTMILFYSVGTGLIFLGWIPLLVTTLGVVIGLEHEESREPSFRDSMYSAWRVFRKLKVILLWIGFILLLSGVIISTIVLLTLENRINHSKVPAESKRGRAFLPLTWTAVGTACVSLCWISYLRLVHLDREEFEEVFGTD